MKDIELQAVLDLHKEYRKKTNRLGVFLFLFPIIYLLVENSVDIKINFAFFDFKDDTLIKLFFPTFYGLLFLYFTYTDDSSLKLYYFIETAFEKDESKKKWLSFIKFPSVTQVLVSTFSLSNFGTFILLVPFLIIIALTPSGFFIYVLYKLFLFAQVNNNIWYWILFGFNIWLFIGNIYYTFSSPTSKEDFKKLEK